MIAWLAACTPPDARYDGYAVVRVRIEDLPHLEALGGDVWTEHPRTSADVMLSPAALRRLEVGYEVVIPDVQDAIHASMSTGDAGFFGDWRPLDEIEDHLDALDDASDDAVVVELGTSLEGRPIRGIGIDVGVQDDRPGILVTGVQHAREWVAGSTALWIATRLVEGRGTDPEVDDLLARYRVVVVPVVNPDGYDHTWSTDRLWRKNRRDNLDGTYGVDLNRNWDAAWGGAGSSAATDSDNYRGTAPFSEPETAAIRDWIEAHPIYGVHVDLHCTGQVVLWPWGFTPNPPPDPEVLDGGATAAAAALTATHGQPYDSGQLNLRLYPASGVGIDWSYGVHGLNSWLIELRDKGQYGFLLPADQIVPTGEEAWAGLMALADQPPARLDLTTDGLFAGQPGNVRARRSTDGATVDVYRSFTGPGTTVLADGSTLGLDAATLVGSDVADHRGRARVGFPVPYDAAGTPVWFQATDGTTPSIVLAVEVQ